MTPISKHKLFDLIADNLNISDIKDVMQRCQESAFVIFESDTTVDFVYFYDEDDYEIVKYNKKNK